MRKVVLQSGRKHPRISGAAGFLLGVTLTLSAVGIAASARAADAVAPPRAPAIQQMAGTTDAIPVAAPSAPQTNPQFQSQQYQNEVQRQLQLLYQQNPQNGQQATTPQPPAGAPPAPKKMRMKDWFSPSAWKRQYTRRQRLRKYEEEQQQRAASSAPDAELGAPAELHHGGSAPLQVAPSVALPQSPAPAPLNVPAPQTAAAPQPASNQLAAPASQSPAPTAAAARPQLQRVSPEIFAGGPEDTVFSSDTPANAASAAPTFDLRTAGAPQAATQPRLLPTPQSAEPGQVDASVALTPLLIIVPDPEQPPLSVTAALPAAPPAEMPSDGPSATTPAEDAFANGFIDERAEPSFEFPPTNAADEPLLGAEPRPAVTELAPLTAETSGPFSGLELDDNPFVDRAPSPAEPSPFVADPAPLAAPAVDERVQQMPADSSTLTAQATPLLAPPPPAETKPSPTPTTPVRLSAQTRALESSAPAPLSPPTAGRPLTAPPPATAPASRPEVQFKLTRIAERKGLTGFKGFCPVMLKDYRELVDARLEFTTEFDGRQYWFSSAAARETFLSNPSAFVPARNGIDVVIFDRTGESRDGSLDHAVWYRGQLYLFDSAETQAAFSAEPQAHQVND